MTFVSQVLFQARGLIVVTAQEGVQVSVGEGHDFRSETLTGPEMMRLAGLLRLAAEDA